LNRRRAALYALLALGYLGGTLLLGTRPPGVGPGLLNDKLLHGLVFLLMVLISYPALRALAEQRPGWREGAAAVAAVYAVVVGGALELIQAGLPYRSAEFWDWFADAVGALGGYLLLLGVLRWPRLARS
jgi:VanZ family protein